MTPLLEVEQLRKIFPIGLSRGGVSRWLSLRRGGAPAGPKWLHAVDGVDLAIMPGETVGLVGESGCGKSTLARLITRLADPTSGTVRLGGRDITAIDAHRFATLPERSRIQMVFQDPTDSLNPRYTAFDAIADPLRRLERLRGREVARRVQEVAGMVGIASELLTRFPHQLSGGQKARVGIARALATRPVLLILDEPTSALDVSVQARILQLLDGLQRQLGMSYLFVSHDLNIVRLLCHQVVVMYIGKVMESGPTAEVVGSPAHPYTRMLLAAVPNVKRRREAGWTKIVGEPGSPIDPVPNACRFAGRCPDEAAICRQVEPPLRKVGPNHLAACHFARITK